MTYPLKSSVTYTPLYTCKRRLRSSESQWSLRAARQYVHSASLSPPGASPHLPPEVHSPRPTGSSFRLPVPCARRTRRRVAGHVTESRSTTGRRRDTETWRWVAGESSCWTTPSWWRQWRHRHRGNTLNNVHSSSQQEFCQPTVWSCLYNKPSTVYLSVCLLCMYCG